jgi:hypothetical protein
MKRTVGTAAVAALLAAVAVGRPATAGAADAGAAVAEQRALDAYLDLRFEEAIAGLETALAACRGSCSAHGAARLHMTLAFVEGAGEHDLVAARRAFEAALRLDPQVTLDPATATPELARVFDQARAETVRAEAPPTPRAPEPTPAAEHLDQLALYAEGDLALTTAVNQVCSPAGPASWTCFDANGARYGGVPQPHMDNDNVRPGLLPSTLRLVAAYDRLVSSRLSAGLRLGWAFGGGPTPPGGSAFLPLHVEARLSFAWPRLGALPVSPFAFVAGGIEEVDTRTSVLVVEVPCSTDYSPRCARRLSAWHRAGFGFAGAGAGVRFAMGEHVSFIGDVRASVTFGGLAFVLTPELGGAYLF